MSKKIEETENEKVKSTILGNNIYKVAELEIDTSKMSIYEKIQKARVMILNIALKKSGKNEKYNYEFFEFVYFIPYSILIFSQLKLYSAFNLHETIGELTIRNLENLSEMEIFSCPTKFASLRSTGDTTAQDLGATITYIKRYLYLNVLELTEHDEVNRLLNESLFQERTDAEKAVNYIKENMEKYRHNIEEYIAERNTTLGHLKPEQLIELCSHIRELKRGAKE